MYIQKHTPTTIIINMEAKLNELLSSKYENLISIHLLRDFSFAAI